MKWVYILFVAFTILSIALVIRNYQFPNRDAVDRQAIDPPQCLKNQASAHHCGVVQYDKQGNPWCWGRGKKHILKRCE